MDAFVLVRLPNEINGADVVACAVVDCDCKVVLLFEGGVIFCGLPKENAPVPKDGIAERHSIQFIFVLPK